MAGKKLRFMGYLPVKAGDWVFTDGTFIFGNVPPKGSPAVISSEPSGIPVLGDFDSQDKELRGYFTASGIYKRYAVAKDDWIVNSDKKFIHGSNTGSDGAEIIDAEIAFDKNGKADGFYTVWKKLVQVQDDDEDSDVLFYYYDNAITLPFDKRKYYSMLKFERRTRGVNTDISKYQYWWLTGDFDYIKNTSPTVTQATWDGSVNTPPIFTPKEEPLIRDCELIIKKDGQEIETLYLSELAEYAEEKAVNSVAVPLPVDASTPNIVTFGELSIQSRANLINFKIMPDGSWEALFQIEIGVECTYDRQTKFPTTSIIYSLDYATSAGHNLFLFKVDSAGKSEKLAEYSVFMPLWLIKNVQWNIIKIHDFTGEYPVDRTTFPYTDWVETHWHYDPDVGSTSELTTYDVYDSHNMPHAHVYNKKISSFSEEGFKFPVQDEYYAKFSNIEEDIDKWQLDGIFDARGEKVCKEFQEPYNYHKSNLSFVPLKSGDGLFGIHNKSLYKIDRYGNSQQIGYGLKNFRLRELKKISKARR